MDLQFGKDRPVMRESEVRILEILFAAAGSLCALVLSSSAAESLMVDHRHIMETRIIFVAVGVLFLAGLLWRMSRADHDHRRRDH